MYSSTPTEAGIDEKRMDMMEKRSGPGRTRMKSMTKTL